MPQNFFDQFDPPQKPGANFFDQFDGGKEKPKESSFLDKTKSTLAELPIGAAGAIKALSDAFGAGNEVSRSMEGVIEGYRAGQTPERKAELQAQAARTAAAEQSGSVLEELKAAGTNFIESPLSATLGAAGSVAPVAAGAMLAPVVGVGGTVAAGAMGAGMGAGAVKGAIYDDQVKRGREAGLSPAEAEAKATEAQAYDGKNVDQIAIGAGLGVLAGTTGVEKVLTGGGTSAIKSAVGRTLAGSVAEAVPEAAQGGQEKLAANLAAQREGADVPTWQGVAGQAAAEGLASTGPGAVAGASTRYVPENGPLSRGANTGIDTNAAEQVAAASGAQQPEGATPLTAAAAKAGPAQPDADTDHAIAALERQALAQDVQGRTAAIDARVAEIAATGTADSAAAQELANLQAERAQITAEAPAHPAPAADQAPAQAEPPAAVATTSMQAAPAAAQETAVQPPAAPAVASAQPAPEVAPQASQAPQAATPEPAADPRTRWAEMPVEQRQAVVAQMDGLSDAQRQNLPRAHWGYLNAAMRDRLAQAMAPQPATAQPTGGMQDDGTGTFQRTDAGPAASGNPQAGLELGRGAADTQRQPDGGQQPAMGADAGTPLAGSGAAEPAGVAGAGRAAVAPAATVSPITGEMQPYETQRAEVAGEAAPPGGTQAAPAVEPIEVRAGRVIDDLRAMAQDAGWSEVGGRMVRDQDGNVSRTKWIPRAEWFMAGMEGKPDILAQHIEDFAAGKRIPIKSRRTIESMTEWREAQSGGQILAPEDRSYYELDVMDYESRPDRVKQQYDDFDDFTSEAGAPQDTAGQMRALGFTEQEIESELRREVEAGAVVAGERNTGGTPAVGRDDLDPQQGQARAGAAEVRQEGLTLDSYTRDDLAQREAQQQAAADLERRTEQQAAQRAEADAQRADFTLTGSDRDADVAAARGQEGLFDQPAPDDGPRFSRGAATQPGTGQQFRDTERAYGGREAYERENAAGLTKLNYRQWVQVRTPAFKAWFGNWEALKAQSALDAMQPVQIRVPDEWRGRSVDELRAQMGIALDEMVRSRASFAHPVLGEILVGRTGAKKSASNARDPAKALVVADVGAIIPASVYARSEPSRGGDGPNIDGYSTLLARVEVDGLPLIATITVRHQSDGKWYYNTVTLNDGREKAQDSYGRPDQQSAGSRFAPITGLDSFVRQPLRRVNPDTVSKVTNPETGEPMVVYHGTNADFSAFDKEYQRAGQYGGKGFFFTADPETAGLFGDAVMPVFLNARIGTLEKRRARAEGREVAVDHIRPQNDQRDIWVVFDPEQIKSATGNTGDFDGTNPDIRRSFAGQSAATADTMALDNAKRRIEAGEDAETVRQETGWFRGAGDGKWRFEINDADAKLRPALRSLNGGGYDARQIASVTYRKRDDGTYDVTLNPPNPQKTSDFVTLTGISEPALRAVLPEDTVAAIERNEGSEDLIGDFEEARRISVEFKFDGFNALPLEDVLDHPALFAAYPALRDVMVQVDPKLGNGGSFAYVDHKDGTTTKLIRLGSGRQLSTLLHEIQHGIQNIEGFATGGTAEAARRALTGREALKDRLSQAMQQFMTSRDDVVRSNAAQEMVYYGKLLNPTRKLDGLSPNEIYTRLAGEVEARNVQARQGMTADERRSTPPSATADVADSDVIVVFNGAEMASAPAPANADLAPAPRGLTESTLRAIIAERIPSLSRAVDAMLRRGEKGQKGGLVVIASGNELDIAEVFASKTGRNIDDAVQMFSDADGINGFYDPRSGITFLVGPNVTAETAPAVLLHESIHGQQRQAVDAQALAMLDGRQNTTGRLRSFLDGVAARMDAAGEAGNAQEAAAYIVEEAMMAGRQAGFSAIDGRLMNWIDMNISRRLGLWLRSFVASVRAWSNKLGVPVQLTVDDLVAIAKAGVKQAARGDVVTSGSAKASRAADITQTANFRAWFADSKMRTANGKPITFMHGSPAAFEAFDNSRLGEASGHGTAGLGHFFTRNTSVARKYADGGQIYRGWLRMQNPYVMQLDEAQAIDGPEAAAKRRAELQRLGADGVVMLDDNGNPWAFVVFEPWQFKSQDNRGTFDDFDNRFRFSRGASQQPQQQQPATPQAVFASPALPQSKLGRAFDRLIYTLQDRFIDLKEIQKAIIASGRTVRDIFNPYQAETLMHGTAAYRNQQFIEGELQPLVKMMREHSVKREAFETYLHARHAKERNAAMAKINPSAAELDQMRLDAEVALKAAEASLQAAPNDSRLQRNAADARAKLMHLRAAKPWSGTEEDRLSLSGMTDAEADAILATETPLLKRMGEMVDAITTRTREEMLAYGLETAETVAAMESAYQHYVPLKRDMEESDLLDSLGGTGRGFSIRGTTIQRATGSNREVENILANLVAAREQVIVRGEKNRMAKAMYGMVLEHPNPELYTAIRPGMPEKVLRDELTAMGLDPVLIDGMVKAPAEPRINPNTGLVERRVDPRYAALDNAMVVRVQGEDRVILFNKKSDRAVRLVRALRNDDAEGGGSRWIMEYIGPITRYLASINTQYNPIFGLTNFARDIQGAMLNLTTTELNGKQAALAKTVPSSIRGIWNWERGDKSHPWAKIYEEFLAAGGATGYRDQFANIEDRAKAIEREIGQTGIRNAKGVKETLDLLSDYNTTIENSIRLAAYKQARDAGLSQAKAASLAKDITVNFNRKGARSSFWASLFAFFNSAVQGTERTARVLTGPAGRKLIAAGVALGSLNTLMMMAMLGDDWDKIPEFEKAKHIFFPAPWKESGYIKIPMPLGFHAIPNIGRTMTEMAVYRNRLGERTVDMLTTTLDAFNPLGSGSLLAMALPSVLDPAVELAANQNSFGRSIYKEDISSLDPTPGYTRARDGTSGVWVEMARWINAITGGDEYEPGLWSPAPEVLTYAFGVAGGGLLREVEKIWAAGEAGVIGETLPPHRWPILGRFYGEAAGDDTVRRAYSDAQKVVNIAENRMKGMYEAGETPDSATVDLGLMARLMRKDKAYISDLAKMRAQTTDADRKKELDMEILEIQQRFVQSVREIEVGE